MYRLVPRSYKYQIIKYGFCWNGHVIGNTHFAVCQERRMADTTESDGRVAIVAMDGSTHAEQAWRCKFYLTADDHQCADDTSISWRCRGRTDIWYFKEFYISYRKTLFTLFDLNLQCNNLRLGLWMLDKSSVTWYDVIKSSVTWYGVIKW